MRLFRHRFVVTVLVLASWTSGALSAAFSSASRVPRAETPAASTATHSALQGLTHWTARTAGSGAPRNPVLTTTTYQWDNNGNLAAKLEAGRSTLYRFDAQNRLIDLRSAATLAQAQVTTPVVRYGYDAQGNRIRKTTSAASAQGAATTHYLIDQSYGYPQVAVESRTGVASSSNAGSPQTESTAYLWGTSLIRQTRAGAGTVFAPADANHLARNDLFPLQGHLNTSLGALDVLGNLAEVIEQDAFGALDANVAGSTVANAKEFSQYRFRTL